MVWSLETMVINEQIQGQRYLPEQVIDDYGADALRLWAANSVPGSDVPFAWKDVKHGYKFLRVLECLPIHKHSHCRFPDGWRRD